MITDPLARILGSLIYELRAPHIPRGIKYDRETANREAFHFSQYGQLVELINARKNI